jgi:hypothetical protein
MHLDIMNAFKIHSRSICDASSAIGGKPPGRSMRKSYANISKNQTRLSVQARVTASGDLATKALGLEFRLGVLVFGA